MTEEPLRTRASRLPYLLLQEAKSEPANNNEQALMLIIIFMVFLCVIESTRAN